MGAQTEYNQIMSFHMACAYVAHNFMMVLFGINPVNRDNGVELNMQHLHNQEINIHYMLNQELNIQDM